MDDKESSSSKPDTDAVVEVFDKKSWTKDKVAIDIHTDKGEQILRERAQALAQIDQTKEQDQKQRQFVQFQLGTQEQYGIDYKYLKEVIKPQEIVNIPCAPAFIAGVTNVRSEIIPVLDLKYFLKIQESANIADVWVIVVQYENLKVGILADKIHGSSRYDPATLTPPLNASEIKKQEYIEGIFEGKVTLIKIDVILNDPEINSQAK